MHDTACLGDLIMTSKLSLLQQFSYGLVTQFVYCQNSLFLFRMTQNHVTGTFSLPTFHLTKVMN